MALNTAEVPGVGSAHAQKRGPRLQREIRGSLESQHAYYSRARAWVCQLKGHLSRPSAAVGEYPIFQHPLLSLLARQRSMQYTVAARK